MTDRSIAFDEYINRMVELREILEDCPEFIDQIVSPQRDNDWTVRDARDAIFSAALGLNVAINGFRRACCIMEDGLPDNPDYLAAAEEGLSFAEAEEQGMPKSPAGLQKLLRRRRKRKQRS